MTFTGSDQNILRIERFPKRFRSNWASPVCFRCPSFHENVNINIKETN